MSIAVPYSHLYIFTETQRNTYNTEEALNEYTLNFIEDVLCVLQSESPLSIRPLTFWDYLKTAFALFVGLLISVLLFVVFIISFSIGLILLGCRKTWNYVFGVIKNVLNK